jgi:hypothetical protein
MRHRNVIGISIRIPLIISAYSTFHRYHYAYFDSAIAAAVAVAAAKPVLEVQFIYESA